MTINPIPGKVYLIHHSSGNVPAKFSSEIRHEGNHFMRARSRFTFLNLKTGHCITLKSRAKIIREITNAT